MSKVYTRNTWVNDAPPAISATNLNNVEEGVLTNNRQDLSIVVTPPTDADYTLTAAENQYGRIEIDTTNWTTARNIIMNNDEHTFLAVVNNTGSQNATFKTSAGTGILVNNNEAKELRNDTVNVINYEGTQVVSLLGTLDTNNMISFRDEKTSGTAGGSSSVGSNTRTLNTIVKNTIAGVTLSSNIITGLPAGTYYARGRAPSYRAGGDKLFLYNNTDSSDLLIGSTSFQGSATNVQTDSFVNGFFTIAGTKDITLRHYITSAQATIGLGVQATTGQTEVYAEIEIYKVG